MLKVTSGKEVEVEILQISRTEVKEQELDDDLSSKLVAYLPCKLTELQYRESV